MIEIELPSEVQKLVEGSVFDTDGLIEDNALAKYLFYLPELIRIYGTALADLEAKKRLLEIEIDKDTFLRNKRWSSTLIKLDSITYKNEDMRSAKMFTNSEYSSDTENIFNKQTELVELTNELEKLKQVYYKFKNMQTSLTDLTKLRVAERQF